MNNCHIKIYWKGLKGEQAFIGEFFVSEKTLDRLEESFPNDLSIDCWAETEEALHSFKTIIEVMKNTEYGKIAYKPKKPFYQKHILASLKEATGVEWKVEKYRKANKPRFIDGGKYEWWQFVAHSKNIKQAVVYISGLTVNGRFISIGMHNSHIATMVVMPDYNGNGDFDAIAETFKKFQSE